MYSGFGKIDGRHPLRTAVPDGFVDYRARTRHGGEVFYFNFDLAKQMGLIPRQHPATLNQALRRAILDAFSLVIINEYDLIHKTPIPKRDIRPHAYMATRYLQLQHPSRKGYTSGDGRSIWNGYFQGRDATWDVSSCGTGATRLSPATAIHGKFFKTGDPAVSYGCGRAELLDGLAAAIMSEIFHRNGHATERTLAILRFSDGTAINVRAGKNLLRPAHFFMPLKQADHTGLKGLVDYYIARQVANGTWPPIREPKRKYTRMLERIATDFARAAARFEADYIFCWLDWDGDNILADGGIIDYGSVRQFGLYHNEYRYDDVDRMSTTIAEQKSKAKYIVQTFAQLTDFLITGKKRNIKQFANHPALNLFDEVFAHTKDDMLLYNIGFDENERHRLLTSAAGRRELAVFRTRHGYFERAKSKRGPYKVADGVNWDAIFCVRDILRELPRHFAAGRAPLAPVPFLEILKSAYATADDLVLTRGMKTRIREFQAAYWRLVQLVAELTGRSPERVLRGVTGRSDLINRYARVTGDSIIHVAETLVAGAKTLGFEQLYRIFSTFVDQQVLRPEYSAKGPRTTGKLRDKRARAALNSILTVVNDCREGI